jgi:hypothetical protein
MASTRSSATQGSEQGQSGMPIGDSCQVRHSSRLIVDAELDLDLFLPLDRHIALGRGDNESLDRGGERKLFGDVHGALR